MKTLADDLARACELLPGRFKMEDSYRAQWFKATYDGKAEYVYTVEFLADGQTCEGWGMVGNRQAHLEYACREEIEARGWRWGAGTLSGCDGFQAVAMVTVGDKSETVELAEEYASTPAHALLLALLSAVEGEG